MEIDLNISKVKDKLNISKLKTEDLSNPLGIDVLNPALSWILTSKGYNQAQTAYQVLAAFNLDELESNEGELWDSGKVETACNFGIKYGGSHLQSRQRIYWKVMVWDENNNPSEWSEVAYFEVGLLNPSDWEARWIGRGDSDIEVPGKPVPMFVKDFVVLNINTVKTARLYISGLGLYEAHMNGQKISETYFDPGETDCRKTVLYATYDVTNLLSQGNNAIGFMLGNGIYANYQKELTPGRYQKVDGFQAQDCGLYGPLKGIAQLEITLKDDTSIKVSTCDQWHYINSPITFNNWYGGEDYDARKEVGKWDAASIERSNWSKAALIDPPKGKLKARKHLPIEVVETLVPATVKSIGGGKYLVDMGRNSAGFIEILLENTTSDMAGTAIECFPSENLNPDGTVNQASCTQNDPNPIYVTYVIKGTGVESWHPSFVYHGYRYIEVHNFPGVPTTGNFKGYILRTINEKNGFFETSDPDINMINTIIRRSVESNMYSSLTDCPHIEKLGWLEVSHLMLNSMSYNFDVKSWIPKIVGDIIDSQYEDGYVPAIAPEFQDIRGLDNDPNWGGTCILLPWNNYLIHGNKTLLVDAYETMVGYVTYLEESSKHNNSLIDFAQMGDWGGYDTSTTKELVASCAFYNLVDTFVKIAELLEKSEDAITYRKLANKIKNSFNEKFYDTTTGKYGTGSQASYACALYAGVVENENIQLVLDNLVEAVRSRDWHLSTGEVALKQMLAVLGMYGRSDVVYKMATNKTMPSYLYFIKEGATTLPEYWDMVRSQNHAMMGHIQEWFFRYLAGIDYNSVAYRDIVIKPYIPEDLSEVNAFINTTYGKVSSHWKVDNEAGNFIIEVEIPVSTKATIYVPRLGYNNEKVFMGLEEVSVYLEPDYLIIGNIGSGKYTFTRNKDI